MFGTVDQERSAEREICNIVQKGAAATYAANFQRHAAYTNWDDTALTAQYYKGLKDFVKDEISRSERPSTLAAMIEKSVIIDNRAYERSMEKSQKNYVPPKANKPRENTQYNNKPYYGPQPMEIDATFRKNRFQRGAKPQVQRGTRVRGNCYSCGKPGHFARDCRVPTKTFPTKKKTYAAALKEPAPKEQTRHEAMSWTACYIDSCPIHRSDKDGSGWYPRKPKSTKTFAVASRFSVQRALKRREAAVREGQYVDSEDEFPSSEEEGFVEVADSEDSGEFVEKDDEDWLSTHEERWIRTYSEVLNAIKARKEEYADRVEELKDQILYTIRDVFTQTVGRERTNYRDIVKEVPPKGSQFTTRGIRHP